MANPMVDVEKKLHTANLVDEIESASKKRGLKLWMIAPVTALAITGCAFLVVRRFRRG